MLLVFNIMEETFLMHELKISTEVIYMNFPVVRLWNNINVIKQLENWQTIVIDFNLSE